MKQHPSHQGLLQYALLDRALSRRNDMALESVGALLASKWGPLVVQGGLTGISALYGAIAPNRGKELQDEVVDGYRQLRQTAQRQARGQFTPSERSMMRANAQPQLQQVAGSIASRGLGSSPAGAQIAAGAEQAVFTNAQRLAAQQEMVVNREAFMAATELVQRDEGFFQDLQRIASAYAQLRELGLNPDPEVDAAVRQAIGMSDGYSRGTDSRGDDI